MQSNYLTMENPLKKAKREWRHTSFDNECIVFDSKDKAKDFIKCLPIRFYLKICGKNEDKNHYFYCQAHEECDFRYRVLKNNEEKYIIEESGQHSHETVSTHGLPKNLKSKVDELLKENLRPTELLRNLKNSAHLATKEFVREHYFTDSTDEAKSKENQNSFIQLKKQIKNRQTVLKRIDKANKVDFEMERLIDIENYCNKYYVSFYLLELCILYIYKCLIYFVIKQLSYDNIKQRYEELMLNHNEDAFVVLSKQHKDSLLGTGCYCEPLDPNINYIKKALFFHHLYS